MMSVVFAHRFYLHNQPGNRLEQNTLNQILVALNLIVCLRISEQRLNFAHSNSHNSVDQLPLASYYKFMTVNPLEQNLEMELARLESHIDDLIEFCRRLKEENNNLRTKLETYNTERATLIEKNETARTKVAGMIERLKSMEQLS